VAETLSEIDLGATDSYTPGGNHTDRTNLFALPTFINPLGLRNRRTFAAIVEVVKANYVCLS
jgi:hypothetical protein